MAIVTLFTPQDLEVPQIDGFHFNEYYIDNQTYYAGLSGPGESIDFLVLGHNFRTQNAVATAVLGYMNGEVHFALTELNLTARTFYGDYWIGRSLGQIRIFSGNDQFWGSCGNDRIYGWQGDDLIVGGDGSDILWGGLGSDLIYGQGGNNTFLWEVDGSYDRVVIMANGFTDYIYNLDRFDEIIVQGASSSELVFGYVEGGIGVFARGVHEATYFNLGTNLIPGDLANMARGEFG